MEKERTKEILEQLFILTEELKSLESIFYCDTLACTYNVKYEYLCFYKSFLDKHNIIETKTLFALFSEQNISEIHFIELKELVERLNLYLSDSSKNHKQYNAQYHGNIIMKALLETKYLDSINSVYKAIKRLQETDSTDPCTQEYQYIYSQQEYSKTFSEENKWLYQFNPYKEFKATFDFLTNFIDNYMNYELVYFSLKDCSIIYELCNGKFFEKARDIDFYKFLNLSGSKEIRIKKEMRDKTCFLIRVLAGYLVSDEEKNIKEWECKILKRLKIKEATCEPAIFIWTN